MDGFIYFTMILGFTQSKDGKAHSRIIKAEPCIANIKEVKQKNDILSNYEVPPDDLMNVFKAYVPLIAIRGEVAGILIKSNMHLTIGKDESSPELEIDKERWGTFRARILEAIAFYYK